MSKVLLGLAAAALLAIGLVSAQGGATSETVSPPRPDVFIPQPEPSEYPPAPSSSGGSELHTPTYVKAPH